jgi:diguanylate cyclase
MSAPRKGTLGPVGLPAAAVLAVAAWLGLHGAGLDTGLPAALCLLALTALAERIELDTDPRTTVSTADPFAVAAALVGGPLLGACAGAWRRRSTSAGVGALRGFAIGVLGEQLAHRGVSGAVALAVAGLLTGLALDFAALALVALDRGARLRPVLRASWRSIVVAWLLPGPLLVSFLFVFQTSPALACVLAAGLLLLVAAGDRSRLRLEQTLAKEQSRARVDALTDAPNRYALAEALAAEQARIRRGGRPAAVCFLDLDRFKAVNDTYGYAAGDALLVDVCRRLRTELRASDLVFRWGGEEFVVLAPHVERAELRDFAERLRLLVATRPFSIDGRPRTITGSVGAVLLDEGRPADAALEAAGRLVRKAKLTRNSAVVETVSQDEARRPLAVGA